MSAGVTEVSRPVRAAGAYPVAPPVPLHDLVELYRNYEKALRKVAMLYLGDPTDAEDAVQETFARVAGRLEAINGDAGGYLMAILRHVCCDERRRRSRIVASDEVPITGGQTADAETLVADHADLTGTWSRLSQRDQGLIARCFAGYSYEEIAQQLGMKAGALNVALARARKRARHAAAAFGPVAALVGWLRAAGRAARKSQALSPGMAAGPALFTAATAVSLAVAIGGLQYFGHQAAPAPQNGERAATARFAPTTSATGHTTDTLAGARPGQQPGEGGTAGTGAVSTAGVTHSLVAPGQGAQQQDTVFGSVTASPDYAQDHTVFASGSLAHGCGRPACPVLFRTTDGGRSWTSLPATGFVGGTVLLPPSYPADPVIFGAGPDGLQRSDDGGASFRLVVPMPNAPAAIDPSSSIGDARVLVAGQAPLLYDAASGRVTPGPVLPPGVSAPTGAAFATDGTTLFTATQPDATAQWQEDAVVVRCAGLSCAIMLAVPGQQNLSLSVSPTVDKDGTVFAWSPSALAVSRDAGAHFTIGPSPVQATTVAVALSPHFARDGAMVIVAASPTKNVALSLSSSDGGHTFASAEAAGLGDASVSGVALLPDGTELVALSQDSLREFGLRCSHDTGHLWGATC